MQRTGQVNCRSIPGDASDLLTIKGGQKISIQRAANRFGMSKLRYMADIGLLKHQFSDAQRLSRINNRKRNRNPDPRPTAYGLTTKGRYNVDSLMARECPNIEDRDHLSKWFTLIKNQGVANFALLRLLVKIDEAPGQCGRELFTYRSGANNEQVDRLVDLGLLSEEMVGPRKEKYPGERWLMLRDYLNWPIPDSALQEVL